jgi:ParB-like chromosome segregation protein Spo0J
MELRQVPPSELDLSLGRLRQISAGAVRQKSESLRDKGQLSPLVAADHDDRLILVDGFARLRAALHLGWARVLVAVVRLSGAQMKAQIYLRNRKRGLLFFEECRLVRELAEVEKLNQVEIGDILERHKSWVCRRLFLCRSLSPQLIEDAELGLLGEGSLRRLALLPPRNQEELVTVARRDTLASHEIVALLELWRRASDPEVRRYLLEHPRDALERAQGQERETDDPHLGKDGKCLLESLVILSQVSLRIQNRLRARAARPSAEGMADLQRARARAEGECRRALEAVEQWLAGIGGDR